jgi:oxygen-independent coproporphyrinogen-3 oxidase
MTESSFNQLPQFTIIGSQIQPNSLSDGAVLTAGPWLNEVEKAIGAYIHVPFCFHKCHYCDFFSIVGKEDQHELFVQRLLKELEFVGAKMTELRTVFIGGGTPTLLSLELFDKLLQGVRKHLPLAHDVEFTIEANPETITMEKAAVMVSQGVNRVSIGAQSFNTDLLKQLERWHDPVNVGRAVEFVRSAGIDNISLDLIYAIPTQTVEQVNADLQDAISLLPTHLSCYALTYEPNTPLLHKLNSGSVTRVDHDVEADMFDVVAEVLLGSGYKQYEISNFAKDGFACKHNLMYWKNKNWWSFGPAASGHIDGQRWKNSPRLADYLSTSGLPPVEDVERLSQDIQVGEAFMMGLRLLEGMEFAWVESLIEQSPNTWRRTVIERNIEDGFLVWANEKLVLTDKGLHFADTVICELLMCNESE